VILVDTSVWIDFWRQRVSTDALAGLIEDQMVLTHDLVIAELAVGNLGPAGVRYEILTGLARLPKAPNVELNEVLSLVDHETLDRRGLSAVDVHLLTSARIARALVWTSDKALAAAAKDLGMGYQDT
jgi:predicted nucleic acid-binding protein